MTADRPAAELLLEWRRGIRRPAAQGERVLIRLCDAEQALAGVGQLADIWRAEHDRYVGYGQHQVAYTLATCERDLRDALQAVLRASQGGQT